MADIPAGLEVVRVRVEVAGTVQGVGFRPFVHTLARELGLGGWVGNDPSGVVLEVEGPAQEVSRLVERLRSDPPPLAHVEQLAVSRASPTGETTFRIAPSAVDGPRHVLVSADVATCADCLAEIADPADRRHRYPFTNCTNCGPRYSIVEDVPYDRARTTMSAFPMCDDCAREYADPSDRRYHAQPVCCPACGPTLELRAGGQRLATGDDALRRAADRLLDGDVLAVKGLGGHHLAALASHDGAVGALRSRKHREEKPFAVMVPDLAAAAELVEVDDLAGELLTSVAAPIVLLPRSPRAPIAAAVAPGNRSLGVMLPYTPLHHLLLAEVGAPIVLTSGNVSDEPIAHRDEDALERLASIADAFLLHDRAIHVPVEDSVVRPVAGRAVPVRRSRGYAPAPVRLPVPADRDVLAVGGELKSTVCLARGDRAFLSPHLGDLEDYGTFRSFVAAIAHLGRLFDVHPDVVAHDLHPEYLSTKHALELEGVELVGVQHHHAHVASCMVDNGRTAPVIGVAFDGTGYGEDGTIWGGEILVADLHGFERAAHLDTVRMPGGAAAVREPWRMAAAHLTAAYDRVPDGLDVVSRNADRLPAIRSMIAAGVNAPETSSTGRLFDAVAALVGLRDSVTYEGQAAVELEQHADPDAPGTYPFPASDTEAGPMRMDGAQLVRSVVDDLRSGVPTPTISARFHAGLADGVADVCRELADRHGLDTVALSGGVFQNARLTARVVQQLGSAGLGVLTHRQVPPNDGGLSLGQAAVAAARR